MKSETVIQLSTMLMLQLNWNQFISAYGIIVLPPADLQVIDPGYLGQLLIRWTLPSNLENPINCSIRFQLQYFNTYEDRWKTIRTTRLSYSAQFDLEKDVHVRVHTLLRGPCINGSEVQSPGAEVVLKPPDKGSTGSKIKSLSCVFYRSELLECTWESGEDELDHPIYHLFYWHTEMAKTMECPKYIYSNGDRTGCTLVDSLPEFTEFNICVNGSSAEGPLRPAYFTLQIQNFVKPAAIEILSLEAQPNGLLHLEWTPSEGRIPGTCLEYEVESAQKAMVGEVLRRNITRETAFTSLSMDPSRTNCFRVRSRVHQFCADSSFWSEWSRPSCLSGTFSLWTHYQTISQSALVSFTDTMEIYMPMSTETIMLRVLPIFVIMLFILTLCLWSFQGRLKIIEKIKGPFYLPYKPRGDFSSPPMVEK